MQTLSSNELTITILALLLLLISSFICGKIFELIKAPKVIGEIVGGMLSSQFWQDEQQIWHR